MDIPLCTLDIPGFIPASHDFIGVNKIYYAKFHETRTKVFIFTILKQFALNHSLGSYKLLPAIYACMKVLNPENAHLYPNPRTPLPQPGFFIFKSCPNGKFPICHPMFLRVLLILHLPPIQHAQN